MNKTNKWGQKVIEKALEYANFEWYAIEENVMHGIDKDGRFVDTPDITWKGEVLDCGWWKVGEKNIGVAYGWGNASTLEQFEIGIKEGKYAGNVPEDKSRNGSYNTVGVDCSGLLTVCWELPKKIATRDIPNYATVIENLEDIPLFPLSASWSGSEVPLIDKKIDFLKRLLSELKGIEYIEHRVYVKERIESYEQYKKEVLIKEYLENSDIA